MNFGIWSTSKRRVSVMVYSDVISSVVTDPTGVTVGEKFGYFRSSHSRDIRLPHFVTNDDDDNSGDAGLRTL